MRSSDGRRLVLAGVEIEHARGLIGHSDADLVAHAVTDALLGAAGREDIGHLFPSDDPALDGASSIDLLARVWGELADGGWAIVNVDALVIMQEPRIAPYRAGDARGAVGGTRNGRRAGDGARVHHRPAGVRRARRGRCLSGGGAAADAVMGVVSFDLDGTLWDFSPMMDGAIAAAIASLEEREPELAGRLTVAALHEQRRLTGLRHEGTLEELRRISLHNALIELGRDDRALAEWMADELLQARADVVVLHDDVEPAVGRLIEDGHLVGAITNGNFPFDRLALAAHFSFVVHAEQAGGAKPGPEPFAEAVRLTGGDPQRLGARRR